MVKTLGDMETDQFKNPDYNLESSMNALCMNVTTETLENFYSSLILNCGFLRLDIKRVCSALWSFYKVDEMKKMRTSK